MAGRAAHYREAFEAVNPLFATTFSPRKPLASLARDANYRVTLEAVNLEFATRFPASETIGFVRQGRAL